MGSYTKADAIERVWRMLRDTGDTAISQAMTDDEIGDFLLDALAEYSQRRPVLKTVDIASSGSNETPLPRSDGWIDDFSSVRSVESPIGANPPNFADPRKWGLLRTPTGLVLRWLIEWPSTSQTVRMTFSTVQSYGTLAADTTVPDLDHGAVCALTAHFASIAMATGYARTHEPILSADAATYRTKSQEWLSVAKNWRDVYENHMQSARGWTSANANWDTRMAGGYAHLTHDRWRR
jgi:hypothetical protein